MLPVYPGQTLRLTGNFLDVPSGVLADPTTLTFKLKSPGGLLTPYTYGQGANIVRAGLGVFYIDVVLTTAGRWHWRWHVNDAAQAADEGVITVSPSSF